MSPSVASPETTFRSRRGWAVWIATGLGVGYLPVMPGTYGSALGVAFYLGLVALAKTMSHPTVFLFGVAVAVAGVSILIVSIALKSFSEEDPQVIVLDEVAGQLLALLPLPLAAPRAGFYWGAVAAGFLLFRALDALKPYPIGKLGYLKGAWGVVADDLGAGVVAAALLAGILHFGLRL